MAFSASGFLYLSFKDMFLNDSAIDWTADTIKVALFTNSITTPNYDTNTAYNAAPYNANEVGSPSGGIALASQAWTISAGMKFDANDTAWGSQSITNARGCLIYDDTIATPTAKPGLIGVTFGADYSVTSGVLTIVWNASGIATLTAS